MCNSEHTVAMLPSLLTMPCFFPVATYGLGLWLAVMIDIGAHLS